MNGGMRSCLKLCSNSILSKLKQSIQPEMAKQRLYSTCWRTISPKQMVVNNFKSTLDHRFSSSSSSNQFFTEDIIASPVENELLEYVEQEITKVKENCRPTVCGFEKKVEKSDLIFTKYLPNETIVARFNTNHCVKVEDSKKSTENQTGGDGERFEYKIKPNFRVEITRDSTTLGFDCIIQGDHSDDGYVSYEECDTSSDNDCTADSDHTSSDDDHECEATSMFNIRNYALYEGKLNENNRAVGNIKDATLYDIMKNLLREKGICDEFLREVIRLGENKTVADDRFFIEKLKEFLLSGKTVWKTMGYMKAKEASSKSWIALFDLSKKS